MFSIETLKSFNTAHIDSYMKIVNALILGSIDNISHN